MKINCYICTTVVSLPSFLPSHTFSSRDPLLPPSPLFPTERETAPSSSHLTGTSSLPASSSATPPVWFSLQGIHPLPPYLSISALPPTPEDSTFDLYPNRCLARTINPNFTGIRFKSRAFSCLWILDLNTFLRAQRNSGWICLCANLKDLIEIIVCFSMEASYLGYLGWIRWNGWKINTWNINFGRRKKKEFFNLQWLVVVVRSDWKRSFFFMQKTIRIISQFCKYKNHVNGMLQCIVYLNWRSVFYNFQKFFF